MAKSHRTTTENAEGGAPATVPKALRDIDFMMRDGTRFAASGGGSCSGGRTRTGTRASTRTTHGENAEAND